MKKPKLYVKNEKAKTMENNQVEHPDHYNKGNIECFDVIKAYYGDDVFEHFCLGNVLKCKSRKRTEIRF